MWLGKNLETSTNAAVKQFSKLGGNKPDLESCKIEIAIGSLLFGKKEEEKIYPGIENIAKYINYYNDSKDMWIIHEVAGISLTKYLFDVKGIFHILTSNKR